MGLSGTLVKIFGLGATIGAGSGQSPQKFRQTWAAPSMSVTILANLSMALIFVHTFALFFCLIQIEFQY